MYRWRMAAIAAFVSSLGQAAVVIDCDFQAPNRATRMVVTEDADGFEFRMADTQGIWLAETLRLGHRGEFSGFAIRFPKTADSCGKAGSPTAEMWCKTEASLTAVFGRADGSTVEVKLDTPGLDLAINGEDAPSRVAYRLFGARTEGNTTWSGAQNGSFRGAVCHR